MKCSSPWEILFFKRGEKERDFTMITHEVDGQPASSENNDAELCQTGEDSALDVGPFVVISINNDEDPDNVAKIAAFKFRGGRPLTRGGRSFSIL